mgnify:CR=1 FL=1
MSQEIIPISEKVIPTVISFDLDENVPVIGDSAKSKCLRGETNIYNFKMELGKPDSIFTKADKYWYAIFEEETRKFKHLETFSLKAVTKMFLEHLLSNENLPSKIILGEPAIRDEKWKKFFRDHLKEVVREIGFEEPPQFFPEPFAVFQYYRNHERIFSRVSKSENILVIDIGAGTFNSCIIRTKPDGDLSRGGATSLPLGLQAEICGGTFVDEQLLRLVINKAKAKGIRWKEDPIERVASSKIPILLHIEKAKISLSNKFSKNSKLINDYKELSEPIFIPKGSLHPEKEINVDISGEDFKEVIREIWRKKWGKIVIDTFNEAKAKLDNQKISIEKIDKVLVAGGSSRLPFVEEELQTLVLPSLIENGNIFIGSDPGNAVAYGIAHEAKEQASRDPRLSVGKLAPCLLNDLFIRFKKDKRDEGFLVPKIKIENESILNGQIINSPFETEDYELSFKCQFPFEPKNDKFYYYFFEQDPEQENSDFLNINSNVISFGGFNKVSRNFDLKIIIDKSGTVKPVFYFKEKGAGARKEPRVVEASEFFIENLRAEEGDSFLGVDFGTFNSYVCRFIRSKKEASSFSYPFFKVNKSILDKLRSFEIYLNEFKNKQNIDKDRLYDYVKKQKLHLIFHSNKIEGNPLTKGETEEVLLRDRKSISGVNEVEAKNHEDAYDWALDNSGFSLESPEQFICEINRKILNNIEPTAGNYRKCPVKISGVDFSPPPFSSVSPFMHELAKEIKAGPKDRSIIEFACSAHTKLVFIHPFRDGNGRTARIFMNAILWHYGLPSIVINYFDKKRYLDALIQSNKGNISQLIDIFLEAAEAEIEQFKEHFDYLELESFASEPEEEPLSLDSEIPPINIEQFLSIADKIKEKEIKEIEYKYEIWKRNYIEIKETYFAICNELNGLKQYSELGFSFFLRPYEMIDFEKYLDISRNKKVSRTWFFGIHIHSPFKRERFLAFFQGVSSEIRSKKGVHKSSLVLTRHVGDGYKRFYNEPISIRELFLVDDSMYVLGPDSKIISGDKNGFCSTFLKEVLEEYFC